MQETVEIPQEVQEEITNLRGFRDLVGERWGYWLGRRLTQADMNEKTKKERKAVRDVRKEIRDNLEDYITNSNIDEYHNQTKKLKVATEKVTTKAKPFREKISPLTKAMRFLDTVAIPDALKELGSPVQPRFSLSDFVKAQLAQQKKK